MFLMLQGRLPSAAQARVLDALLVASIEHGIAPPSMISRCFASYGTSIQAAVDGGIIAFGDRMGGLGEQLARLMAEQLAPLGDPARIGEAQLRVAAQAIVKAARHDFLEEQAQDTTWRHLRAEQITYTGSEPQPR